MEFIKKGYSRIFVENNKVKNFVIDFFKKDDEFEFDYLGSDTILETDFKVGLDDLLSYNGKFEGNLKGLLDEAKKFGHKIIVKVAWASNDGGYDNYSIETYSSFDYEDNTTLANKVADIIINNVWIRGIELEYYKSAFKSESLVNDLKKLFNK